MTSAARTRMLIGAAWLGVALISGVETYVFRQLGERPAPLVSCLAARVPPWIVWMAATPWIVRLTRARLPWRRAVPAHAALCLTVALAFALVYAAMDVATGLTTQTMGFAARVVQSVLSWASVLIVAYLAVIVLGLALDALAARQRAELSRAELATQLARAQLAALTAQLQPHFLFNALNTVLSFVRTRDLASAERSVLLLGDILRDVLRRRDLDEIPLEQEIAMLSRYLELQQMRFERLQVRWELEPAALATTVPALLLQPLVENAVRHGISARSAAGDLRIAARRAAGRLEVEIEDDGPGLPHAFDPERCDGVGLRNTRARLRQRYGDAAELQLSPVADGGLRVSLRLPA